jgi:hypothetical protein
MSSIEDQILISELSLRLTNSLSPDLLGNIVSSGLGNINDFISFVMQLDLGKCIQSHIKLDEQLGFNDIYLPIMKCWQTFLKELMGKLNISKEGIHFINAYLSKYGLTSVVSTLKLKRLMKTSLPFDSNLSDLILSMKYVNELADHLRRKKEIDSEILRNTLSKFPNVKLSELDSYALERTLLSKYWDKVIELGRKTKPKVSLMQCLNKLRKLNEIEIDLRSALIKGEDIEHLMKSLTSSEASILRSALPHGWEDVDVAFSVLRIGSCHSKLKYSPPSYDKVLHFLIIKEWESIISSYIIYSFLKGHPPKTIQDNVRRWLRYYERIST